MSDDWVLRYDGFDRGAESLREALCTLGNGYFAARGAASESQADDVHYPGTYLAGGYNRLTTEIAGRSVENEDLVNLPNWLSLTFRIDGGDWFDLATAELLGYSQELDLRKGLLVRRVLFADQQGRRTRVAQRRLVHMQQLHVAGLQMTFLAENWSGELEVRSVLDGRVVNGGVRRYRQLEGRHLQPLEQGAVGDEAVYLVAQTVQSRLVIAEAARTRVVGDGAVEPQARRLVAEPGLIGHELSVQISQDQPVTVEKIITLYSSRDHAIAEPGLEARAWIVRADSFDELAASHVLAWDQLWRRFDVTISAGNHRAQMILRLHLFHLLQTVSPNTIGLDVGVPARGLHGEAYRGHIFWDEVFIFPLLNLRLPALTRSLLAYRHRRLPEARWAAGSAGLEGAMFPWQSGSSGREESQTLHLNPVSGRWLPDHSHLQRHINIAVAYNFWQHYQVTGDEEFLRFSGGEVIVEVARLLASLTTYSHALDRYEIRGVMGPDEYHDAYPDADEPGVDNNAYTNVMTVWVLLRALELFEILAPHRREELSERLGVQRAELDRWEDITRKMRVVFHDGVISQFEGYDGLAELNWERMHAEHGRALRLDRILEAQGDTANRYKASKQADVLMLLYLLSRAEIAEIFERLGYPLDDAIIDATVDYYLPRTAHGSTLSSVVHSWVLASLDREHSWQFFTEALASDISDVQGGTTAEGIHLGAMAGTVDLLLRCYAGIETRQDVLWLNPALPPDLKVLEFGIHYRGHRLELRITPERLEVHVMPGAEQPLAVRIQGEAIELAPGARIDLAV